MRVFVPFWKSPLTASEEMVFSKDAGNLLGRVESDEVCSTTCEPHVTRVYQDQRGVDVRSLKVCQEWLGSRFASAQWM